MIYLKIPYCAALINPETLEIIVESEDTSNLHPLQHATMNCIDIRAKNAKTNEYICSNLWLLLTREPCPMCAMAAVHSRVSMVIYGSENEQFGALGSRFNLHLEGQLNHHYKVFKNLQGNKCREIWEKYENKIK